MWTIFSLVVCFSVLSVSSVLVPTHWYDPSKSIIKRQDHQYSTPSYYSSKQLPPLLNPRYPPTKVESAPPLSKVTVLPVLPERTFYLTPDKQIEANQKQIEENQRLIEKNQNQLEGVMKVSPIVIPTHETYVYHPSSPSFQNYLSTPFVPNEPKFIVTPLSENAALPSQQAPKPPSVLLTEGYTNVLLQKPTKVHSEKSKRSKTPKDSNTGASGWSFIESKPKKSSKYQNRPALTKNHRDDRLHEFSEDFDYGREIEDPEREDDEEERISDNERISDSDKITDDDRITEDDRIPDEDDRITDEELYAESPEEDGEEEESEETEESKPAPDGSKPEAKDADPKTAPSKDEEESSEEEPEEEDESSEHEEEDEEAENPPKSEHESPPPVATKPIYPGEGQWAKPGIKHRPHITPHRLEIPVKEEQKPDGYDVFEELEQYFSKQKDKFGDQLNENKKSADVQKPVKVVRPVDVIFDPFNDAANVKAQKLRQTVEAISAQASSSQPSSEEGDDDDAEEEADEFVPQRLYTQVRKTEDVKHEPPAPDVRLKEVIKDSKVQTVYSEEGYEDLAYDHAGHVKKAEQDQGFTAFEREKQEKGNPEKVEKLKKKKLKKADSEAKHSKPVPVLLDSIAADSKVTSQPTVVEGLGRIKWLFNESANSTNNETKSEPPSESTNFMSTQELKTTQLKDKSNGDMQLEVESEVKFVHQPNSTSKAHKYVKIFPKVLKDIKKGASKVQKDTEATTIKPEAIETTTLSKNLETLDFDDEAAKAVFHDFSKIKDPIKRRKRASGSGYDEPEEDTDLIDNIKHEFASSTKPPPLDTSKYPYYAASLVNEDSPLKYAENLKNIPQKRAGELSFYKTVDRFECPDIQQDIDPIPDRVKNADKKTAEDDEEFAEAYAESDEDESVVDKKHPPTPTPPENNLGDKIDCLKTKYFGENPLDSPFFKESVIQPVKPIFKEAEALNLLAKPTPLESKINEIFHDNDKKDERKFSNEAKDRLFNALQEAAADDDFTASQEVDPSVEESRYPVKRSFIAPAAQLVASPTPTPLVTLITTPKYTIQLTPNNIYDQIKLLDHLPEEKSTERVVTKVSPTRRRGGRSEDIQKEASIDSVKTQALIEPEAWTREKRPFQIFDINKYLTTTPFPVIEATTVPKQKVFSEVYYKDEIKPVEQLTVFADIFNNIRNASKTEMPARAASDFGEPNAVTVSSFEDVSRVRAPARTKNRKRPIKDSAIAQNIQHETRVPVVVRRPPYRPMQKRPQKTTPIPLEVIPTTVRTKLTSNKILKRRKKPVINSPTSTTVRTTTNIQIPDTDVPSNHQPYVIDFIEDDEHILGLVPPKKFKYKTIVAPNDLDNRDSEIHQYRAAVPNIVTDPAPVTEIQDESPTVRPLNKYHVVGMKPPPQSKVRPYSDYVNLNTIPNDNLLIRRVAHLGHSRTRRSASKGYSAVSRNRGGSQSEGADTKTEETDDYVPHRSKNYHYDEKTGKIVYHNTPIVEEDEYEEIEEIPSSPGVYLEKAEDATHPTPKKVTTKPLLATATPPPDGKGLLDFVVKLKNNPKYKYIPDPTTPKPGSPSTTPETFTTVDPKSTSPPEFLNILSKVKTDKTYKPIADPKVSQSKSSAVTVAPTVEEEEEEEYEDEEEEEDVGAEEEPTKPAIHSRTRRQLIELPVFNIGDFLPKIQTPIASFIPHNDNFIKRTMKQVVHKVFPKLRYMTPYDVARDYYKQTDLYRQVKKLVQNAPGGQGLPGGFQIFDISDYLPKLKPIEPSTPVDYAKYTTIERHRSNIRKAEAEERASEIKPEVRPPPPPLTITTTTSTTTTTTEKPFSTTEFRFYTPPASSTTVRPVQLRRGTRSTTTQRPKEPSSLPSIRRSTTIDRKPFPSGFSRNTRRPLSFLSEATEKVEKIHPAYFGSEPAATNDKAKKAPNRKRPVRIRHTTERQEEDTETVDKIHRRSLDDGIADFSFHFKDTYTDEPEIERSFEEIKAYVLSDKDVIKFEGKKGEKAAETKEEPVKEEASNGDKKTEEEPLKEEEPSEDKEEISSKDKENSEPSKDQEDEEVENEEDEEPVDKQSEQVEVIESKENSTEKNLPAQNKTLNIDNEEEQKEKKDYKRFANENVNETTTTPGSNEEDTVVAADEQIEDTKPNEEEEETKAVKKEDVTVIDPNYDRTKKHGGNYKKTEEEIEETKEAADYVEPEKDAIDEEAEEIEEEIIREEVEDEKEEWPPITRSSSTTSTTTSTTTTPKPVERLADVIKKPDSFYTDPTLPPQINKLGSQHVAVQLPAEVLDQVAMEGDVIEERLDQKLQPTKRSITENPIFEKDPSKRLYFYAAIDDKKQKRRTEEPSTTPKIPAFEKDPNKRLYFYAKI